MLATRAIIRCCVFTAFETVLRVCPGSSFKVTNLFALHARRWQELQVISLTVLVSDRRSILKLVRKGKKRSYEKRLDDTTLTEQDSRSTAPITTVERNRKFWFP